MQDFRKNFFEVDNHRLINLALLLILVLSVIFLISLYASKGIKIYHEEKLVEKEFINPFQNISLEATSAIVYDIKKREIIFSKNAEKRMPLASITKVLSVVTALDLLPDSTVITISTNDLLEEGDSGLLTDEKWKLKDLIDFSLTTSSNDGIAAIAGAAGAFNLSSEDETLGLQEFVIKMNEKAKQIGMTNSVFYNETGLDLNAETSGGYSTARDTAILFSYALRKYPEIFETTRDEKITVNSLNRIVHTGKNTNDDLNSIPGIIASKTGFTDIAGGNLAVIFDPGIGRPVAVIVLGSSSEGRFRDVSLLTEKTFEYISQGR